MKTSIRSARGVTLIELMIAIAMTTFVVGAVLMAQKYGHAQITNSRRAGLFTFEFDAALARMQREIRSSPQVLIVEGVSDFSLISKLNGDTVRYTNSITGLLRNDMPILFPGSNGMLSSVQVVEIPVGGRMFGSQTQNKGRLYEFMISGEGESFTGLKRCGSFRVLVF